MTTTPLPEPAMLQLAAQAWCQPSTSHIEMDVDLATEFARILQAYTAAECAARDALNIKAHGEIRDLNAKLAERDADIAAMTAKLTVERKYSATLRTAVQQALGALKG